MRSAASGTRTNAAICISFAIVSPLTASLAAVWPSGLSLTWKMLLPPSFLWRETEGTTRGKAQRAHRIIIYANRLYPLKLIHEMCHGPMLRKSSKVGLALLFLLQQRACPSNRC